MYVRIRAYLRYLEPEGGKPSTLYQNPGTINPSEKTTSLRSDPPPARPGMGPGHGSRVPGPGSRVPGPRGRGPRAPGPGEAPEAPTVAVDTLDKL